MNEHDHDGVSVSPWMASVPPTPHAPLPASCDADACVVGAGIAGLSVAYQLAREGLSVVVLDDGSIGGGQTKRTTAHLSNVLDDRFTRLERLHGRERTRLAAASHTAAIDAIERSVREESIDCAFERLDGYLCLAPGHDERWLDDELAAARRAGLEEAERLPAPPVAGLEGPCLRFPRQAQFDPLRYLHGLAQAARRAGARIYTGARAESIEARRRERLVCVRGGHTVAARHVVVATNTPFHERVAIHTKQAAYRSYAVAIEVAPGAVPTALYWDTFDPYHYVRLRTGGPGPDLLLVGGEDHRVGRVTRAEARERYDRLDGWARARFPGLGPVVHRWSGQVMEPADGLAFIGPSPNGPDGVLLATGDSGMGMTHGAIAGLVLADLVAGRANPWAALYDPSRKTLAAAGTWLEENAVTALAYGDWLRIDVASDHAVAPGTGRVLGWGTDRRAVYREKDGTPHVFSAVCPHLGGLVAWNEAEQTWDCACHGSRFDRFGRLVHGPANRDLERKR